MAFLTGQPAPSASPQIVEKIKSLILLYPAKQAVTLPALHLVQDQERCVSQQLGLLF